MNRANARLKRRNKNVRTEGQGFEPWRRVLAQPNGLANRPLQPDLGIPPTKEVRLVGFEPT